MKLAEQQGPEHTVLRVEGSLKVGDTARALAESCERIAAERKGALVLDLSLLEIAQRLAGKTKLPDLLLLHLVPLLERK